MKSHTNKILESIKQALTEHLPKGGKALLFGSQARGDARIDSDWDILIILDKEKLEPEDYDKVSFPLTMLGWDLGARINPIMYTMKERNSLVILQLEKAKVFLKQADEMFDLKYWDIASNRYYYACFHAVQALLIQNGLSCKTHDGLIACFGLNFIKTGKISARLGSFLARMEQLRQKGDYNCIYSISEDEISTIKAPARELIETIEVLLAES